MSIDRLHEMTQADAVARLESVILQRDADMAEKLAVKTREAMRFRAVGLFCFGWALVMTYFSAPTERLPSDAIVCVAQLAEANAVTARAVAVAERFRQLLDAVEAQRDSAVELIDEAMTAWRACRRGAR